VRIALVNDSALAREALRRIVTAAGHTIAWIANDGIEAVASCRSDRPDLVLMDLRMPVMDGVECTRRIMTDSPCPILLVTGTVEGNMSLVYDAMGAGALDAVNTPVVGVNNTVAGDRALLDKIDRLGKLGGHARPHRRSTQIPPLGKGELPVPLIAIGASTGGPEALAQVLTGLPATLRAAIVIVQHVNAEFAPGLAEWLTMRSHFPTGVATHGMEPKLGNALIAATDDHVVMTPQRTLIYTPNPKRLNFRPSVDVFFESVVENWPTPCAGVLLTGMGADGARGLLTMRSAGWHTIAQDEASSVVYGMPRAAAQMKAASEILPLDAIGKRLGELVVKLAHKPR
jgi:two-component system response regulator WspF